MKYLWLKSKNEFKCKTMTYYLILLGVFILCILINIKNIKYYNIEDYSAILGLSTLKDQYVLYQILKLASYMYFIFFSVKMIINGIIRNIGYVMMRIDKKKFIISEMMNTIFYIVILRTIINLLLSLIFIKFNSNLALNEMGLLYFKDIIFYSILALLVTLTLNLFSFENSIKALSFLSFSFMIITLVINIFEIHLIYMVIFFIIIFLINIFLFSPSRIYNQYKF